MTGHLVLVVGPSGSGKDTLLAAAALSLRDDPRFRFVRRVITRAPGIEDNEAIGEATFAARQAAGDFALSWEAHGLRYAIPADIVSDLQAGSVIVANVSRAVVAEAAERFPVTVLLITAPDTLRAERLAQRGREGAAAVLDRLSRIVPPLPSHINTRTIINDGTIEEGAQALRICLARCAEDCRKVAEQQRL
jgi:ribose 1,5-bisphosphokinase